MAGAASDKVFTGAIPRLYETHLVPLIFQPYADDLAQRLAGMDGTRVLEIAAGTGVVTRALSAALPAHVDIVATDLNQAMLDEAATIGTARPVEWRVADAQQLPFDDGAFDAVVCQFGAMFFPDKARAFGEARRVLRPGGTYLFNAWDRIETNDFAHEITEALVPLFAADPPRFLARTPHGYHDRQAIERDLSSGGFTTKPRIDMLAARSRAASPQIPAIAYCQGTPLRNEIVQRGPDRLAEATDAATQAMARRFGNDAVDGAIQAHVVTIKRG